MDGGSWCDGVDRTTEFEGPHFLQVLAFEEKRTARQPVERGASGHRRPVREGHDSDGGLFNGFQVAGIACHGQFP